MQGIMPRDEGICSNLVQFFTCLGIYSLPGTKCQRLKGKFKGKCGTRLALGVYSLVRKIHKSIFYWYKCKERL